MYHCYTEPSFSSQLNEFASITEIIEEHNTVARTRIDVLHILYIIHCEGDKILADMYI